MNIFAKNISCQQACWDHSYILSDFSGSILTSLSQNACRKVLHFPNIFFSLFTLLWKGRDLIDGNSDDFGAVD